MALTSAFVSLPVSMALLPQRLGASALAEGLGRARRGAAASGRAGARDGLNIAYRGYLYVLSVT